ATERATLLIRLACIALGSTLVLLAGTGVLSFAAVALLLYLGAAVLLRYTSLSARVPLAGAAVDLVAITALVYAFPLALAPWALSFASASRRHCSARRWPRSRDRRACAESGSGRADRTTGCGSPRRAASPPPSRPSYPRTCSGASTASFLLTGSFRSRAVW